MFPLPCFFVPCLKVCIALLPGHSKREGLMLRLFLCNPMNTLNLPLVKTETLSHTIISDNPWIAKVALSFSMVV